MNDKEHRNLERAGKADTDRILTIPNVLSFFRLALIPVIIVLYAKNEVWWAFGMLVLSGVTDVVDGWVARTYHMVSNFGKAIDPVADKLTQIAVLLCLMPMKCWWVVGILVLKEVSIGIMTLLTLHHTGMVYGAGWYGKLCTAGGRRGNLGKALPFSTSHRKDGTHLRFVIARSEATWQSREGTPDPYWPPLKQCWPPRLVIARRPEADVAISQYSLG